MHTTTLRRSLSIIALAVLGSTLGVEVLGRNAAATAAASTPPESVAAVTPQRLVGPIADVLVRITGGGPCSGTPITGTPWVVTAAHCVLDGDGNVVSRTVVRAGVEYRPVAVLVNPRYRETPSAELDAAVLVMDAPIPGPSATLGTTVPGTGRVTLAGFQPIDSDGTLLRGSGPHDLPVPKSAQLGGGGVVVIESAPAGCGVDVADVEITPSWVRVPCGLIPGASGGGLFAVHGETIELIGITSWVSADITHNGVVPMASLLDLLEHRSQFLHVAARSHTAATVHVSRS